MGHDEQAVDDVLNDGRKVIVFYSSHEHPQLLEEYKDTLTNVADLGIDTEVIDITEDLETAQEHGIRTAPVVVVIDNGETTKYRGVINGLRKVLEHDLLGKSTLFDMCFEKGGTAAEELNVDTSVSTERVEKALRSLLSPQAPSLTVNVLDEEAEEARLSVTPAEDPSEDELVGHDEFGAVFKGFFTEMFGTAVVEEIACAREVGEKCVFEIEGSVE